MVLSKMKKKSVLILGSVKLFASKAKFNSFFEEKYLNEAAPRRACGVKEKKINKKIIFDFCGNCAITCATNNCFCTNFLILEHCKAMHIKKKKADRKFLGYFSIHNRILIG